MTSPRACVINLGCRVNRVESDTITGELLSVGFDMAPEDEADIVIINTCAVTGEAEAKTRHAIRHALAARKEPQLIITGCAVALHAEELTALSSRVYAEPNKAEVSRRALELIDDPVRSFCVPTSEITVAQRFDGRVRVGVKIQDGCRHRCSYCIVWKARGPECSLSVDQVLCQVDTLAEAGIPEVVLTGVNLGAYCGAHEDGDPLKLGALLRLILEKTNIPLLRLSSLEPMDIDDALIDAMVRGGERVANFLHIPLQSGCARTLRSMGRPYAISDMEQLVDRLRERLPQIALSADIICGFPGESEHDFEESYAAVQRMRFSRLHVFRYSARPGTPAAAMPDQIPPAIKAKRAQAMRDLARMNTLADARARIGTHERAVVERAASSMHPAYARLSSFHRAHIADAPSLLSGDVVKLAIMDVDDDGALQCALASQEDTEEAHGSFSHPVV